MNPEMMSIRELVKTASGRLFGALVAPLIGLCKLHRRVGLGFRFYHYGGLIAPLPGLFGREVRQAFYRQTLRRCGRELKVGYGSYFASPDAEVGDNLTTGSYCIIGPCTIGDDVMMASHISIIDGLRQHGYSDLDAPMTEQPGESAHVEIGSRCWIGEGARVAASVGDKAIVGLGAVVTRPVLPGMMVMGNPARVIGNRATPLSKVAGKPATDAAPASAEAKDLDAGG
jgi:virginiamycin A acetyltransferase